ncbi:hypothetical protein KJ810_03835, partial [Patescibacteria group bacterium]|nr:hypothetical protein [Patescibacteria group bacterium]
MKGPRTTRVFIIGAVALVAVVFLSSQVQASLKQEIKKGEVIHLNVISDTVSEVIISEFPFQIIGVAWQSNDPVELA